MLDPASKTEIETEAIAHVSNGHLPSSVVTTIESDLKLSGFESSKLRFKNVTYVNKQKTKTVKILNGSCGEFRSGRLTAILGPSGAGKTSLLNVLSGFKAKGIQGHFEYNGIQKNPLEFRKMSSYIPQDFAMLDLLTVQENIRASADLKLPRDTSEFEKKHIIEEILLILNMKKCRKTLTKNLSNGERKRLSIAVELVTNPPIMFFDEPTSGLDSVASLHVITYLKRLAYAGRIIVCVIHQPSSRLMNYFDDIVVMTKGEVLFCGSQAEMIEYFEKEGFICPSYYNPADFVLEVGSDLISTNTIALIEKNKKCYDFDNLDSCKNNSTDEKDAMLPDTVNGQGIEFDTKMPTLESSKSGDFQNKRKFSKAQATSFQQFSVLIRRSMISMSRNMLAVQLRVIMHIVIAALLGLVFWQIGNDASKVLTNSSCIFFLVMFVFFGNAMPSILLCTQDTEVFVREYLNGWYTIRAYYAAKVISDLPLQFICPTLFTAIVYFMTGQPTDLVRFIMTWGISLLATMIAHFIGLVFGSAFDLQLAIFLVPGATIPFMVFSGFFIRIHELASFL